MPNRRKYTINDIQNIARSKGGECLSIQVKTTKDRLKWKCSKGHIWETQLKNILAGSWCPDCFHAKRRNDIIFCNELARKKGGKCLSQKYINIDTKLLWECKNNHQWWATPNKIQHNRWCPYCVGKNKTIDDFKELAREKGGECLSNEYKWNEKLTFKCAVGHIWEAFPNNVKFSTWCPYCAGKHQTIDDMKALAEERGGKCLSEKYISQTRKLKWQCSDGHTWEAVPNSIKQGSWCPHCNINYGEETVRKYFEAIFDDGFTRVKPNWLNGLELDGYSEKLKIAFEHQGIQHYKQTKRFHKHNSDFKKQQNRDKLKRALCIKEGIILIEIPHVPDITALDVLPEFLQKAFFENNIVINKNIFDIKIDLKSIYGQSQIIYLNNIAHKNNGYLLSDCYLGDRHKLTWKCKEGHIWESSPNSIKQGTWCPFCYGNIRKNISDIQLLAKERGFTLISQDYYGTNAKLKWQCTKGHIWEATPKRIKSGTGCPKCRNIIRNKVEYKTL